MCDILNLSLSESIRGDFYLYWDGHMRKRKFESFDAAIKYLEENGQLTYHGRIDINTLYYVYINEGMRYELFIQLDGLVYMRK